MAISADGARILQVTRDQLRVLEVDRDQAVGPSIDLRPLQEALALPETTKVWELLAAAYLVPAMLASVTPAQARETLDALPFIDPPRDEQLADAIHQARTRPAMPAALPLLER